MFDVDFEDLHTAFEIGFVHQYLPVETDCNPIFPLDIIRREATAGWEQAGI
jgi:hypothetical protein